MDRIAAAEQALQAGAPVLIHDSSDREDETDLVYAAEHITHTKIARLRQDAGGLICTALSSAAAERLGFPYLHDALQDDLVEQEGDLSYDARSAFSYWVNHVDTRTGVTDRDRATTARGLADAATTVLQGGNFDTAAAFRTPGHMAVLRAADGLLDARQGHTEMSVLLAQQAGCTPAATICEMLDAETGDALTAADARAYADRHDFVYLEAADIRAAWDD